MRAIALHNRDPSRGHECVSVSLAFEIVVSYLTLFLFLSLGTSMLQLIPYDYHIQYSCYTFHTTCSNESMRSGERKRDTK